MSNDSAGPLNGLMEIPDEETIQRVTDSVMKYIYVLFDGTPAHQELVAIDKDGALRLKPDLTPAEAQRVIERLAHVVWADKTVSTMLHQESLETQAELARARVERDALKRQIEGRAWDHFEPGFVDGPASEDYPGDLRSDGPYKTELRGA
jgi:hypothetical protein